MRSFSEPTAHSQPIIYDDFKTPLKFSAINFPIISIGTADLSPVLKPTRKQKRRSLVAFLMKLNKGVCMDQNTVEMAFGDFQNLVTGTNMPATVEFIEDLKAGKKFIVDDGESKFKVILADDDTPTLEPIK